MSKIDFSVSVIQVLPNGKHESHVLSESTYFESFSLDSIFSSFEHQVRYWLEQELQTESSFCFNFVVKPSDSDS